MDVVILSDHLDYHTDAVCWALSSFGVSTIHWVTSSFPQKQNLSLLFSNGDNVSLKSNTNLVLQPDVLWMRRPFDPVPHPQLANTDQPVSLRESQYFVAGVLDQMSSSAFCVNHPHSRRRAGNKPAQLMAAKKVGLNIPDTLISNDFDEIKNFHLKHSGEIIYKPLSLFGWYDEKNSYTPYTAKLGDIDLNKMEFSLRAAPSIYQGYVNKAYELRVMVFGKTIMCAKLDTEFEGAQSVDWRHTFNGRPPLTSVELPEKIKQKLLAFMDEMNLVFGCLDIIVTPENEYVFLEVNEQGQFLWLEEASDDLPVLDCFTQFLMARDSGFQYNSTRKKILLTDFSKYREANPLPDQSLSQVVPEFDLFFIEEK